MDVELIPRSVTAPMVRLGRAAQEVQEEPRDRVAHGQQSDEQPGPAQRGPRQAEPLPHAQRVGADRAAVDAGEAHPFQRIADAPAEAGAGGGVEVVAARAGLEDPDGAAGAPSSDAAPPATGA